MSNLYPAPGTALPFENVLNFRELGGYPAADGRTVRRGVFYRSGNLDKFRTPNDIALYESLGLRYILDLRSNLERAQRPDRVPAGARYEGISAMRFANGDDIDFSPEGMERLHAEGRQWAQENGRPDTEFEYFAGLYSRMPFNNPAYRALMQAMDAGETPLLFHCSAGKDRTGVGAMLILLALGASRQTALQDYLLTNRWRKEPIRAFIAANQAEWDTGDKAVREHLFSIEGVVPYFGNAALNAIERRYPSYAAYFEDQFGLSADRLAVLRDRYLE